MISPSPSDRIFVAKGLPVDEQRVRIVQEIERSPLTLIIAPPGTGKSTRIPVYAWKDFPQEKRKTVCVQPRRIAARSLAERVAQELGSRVGAEIGYQVRQEKKAGPNTRVEYQTRGVFLHRLLQDPEGVACDYHCILLDEFHERQIETDWIFGLLLSLAGQKPRFPRIVILSATLNVQPFASLSLPHSVVRIESPLYPVKTLFAANPTRFEKTNIAGRLVAAARDLMQKGVVPDYLAFLPGYREVREAIRLARQDPMFNGWDILPLTGELSLEEQSRVLQPGIRPRLVVATNIAESSLTVPGVRTVIDSGLVRRMDFDVSKGRNALRTVRISRFSSVQRAGRAGRLDAGTCCKLWSAAEDDLLVPEDIPEVQRLDLADWLLQSLFRYPKQTDNFPWLDNPPEEHMAAARRLLGDLGALLTMPSENNRKSDLTGSGLALTETGRAMASLQVEPRSARVLVEAQQKGVSWLASLWVAIQIEDLQIKYAQEWSDGHSNQDPKADYEPELHHLMECLAPAQKGIPRERVSQGKISHTISLARSIHRRLSTSEDGGKVNKKDTKTKEEAWRDLRRCILSGFADRIFQQSGKGGACLCFDGLSARIDPRSRCPTPEWGLALERREIEFRGVATMQLSGIVTLEQQWVEEDLIHQIRTEVVQTTDSSGRVQESEVRKLGALELGRKHITFTQNENQTQLFVEKVLKGEVALKHWNEEVEKWVQRIATLAHYYPEWNIPVFDQEARQLVLEQIAHGKQSLRELRNAEVMTHVKDWLSQEQRDALDILFPNFLDRSGRKRPISIDYTQPAQPTIALKIQDLIGWETHPTIGDGRCPLLIEILAPNFRAVQRTRNLPSFWTTSYPEIKKNLQGRYPKHVWP